MVYGLDVSRTVGFSLFRTVGPISGRALHIRNSPFIKSFVPPVVAPSPSAEPTPARLSVSPPPPSHPSNRAEIQNESSESVPMNTRTQLEYLLGPSASAFGKNQLFQKLVTRGRFWNRSSRSSTTQFGAPSYTVLEPLGKTKELIIDIIFALNHLKPAPHKYVLDL